MAFTRVIPGLTLTKAVSQKHVGQIKLFSFLPSAAEVSARLQHFFHSLCTLAAGKVGPETSTLIVSLTSTNLIDDRRKQIFPLTGSSGGNEAPAVLLLQTLNRLELGRLRCLFLFTFAATP